MFYGETSRLDLPTVLPRESWAYEAKVKKLRWKERETEKGGGGEGGGMRMKKYRGPVECAYLLLDARALQTFVGSSILFLLV